MDFTYDGQFLVTSGEDRNSKCSEAFFSSMSRASKSNLKAKPIESNLKVIKSNLVMKIFPGTLPENPTNTSSGLVQSCSGFQEVSARLFLRSRFADEGSRSPAAQWPRAVPGRAFF